MMDAIDTKELVALAFNSGIVLVVVQVLKTFALPKLKVSAPWAIPLLASVLGFAASAVLAATGIDISPIAGVFSGFAASGMFDVVKGATG